MNDPSNAPPTTAAAAAPEPTARRIVACLLCHTPAPTANQATIDADGGWTCRRCGQTWDEARLATVANYATWAVAHGRHP